MTLCQRLQSITTKSLYSVFTFLSSYSGQGCSLPPPTVVTYSHIMHGSMNLWYAKYPSGNNHHHHHRRRHNNHQQLPPSHMSVSASAAAPHYRPLRNSCRASNSLPLSKQTDYEMIWQAEVAGLNQKPGRGLHEPHKSSQCDTATAAAPPLVGSTSINHGNWFAVHYCGWIGNDIIHCKHLLLLLLGLTPFNGTFPQINCINFHRVTQWQIKCM